MSGKMKWEHRRRCELATRNPTALLVSDDKPKRAGGEVQFSRDSMRRRWWALQDAHEYLTHALYGVYHSMGLDAISGPVRPRAELAEDLYELAAAAIVLANIADTFARGAQEPEAPSTASEGGSHG